MRFLSESKGKYLIEDEGIIIADVKRAYNHVGGNKGRKWDKAFYTIHWYEGNTREIFDTLYDIGDTYRFSNRPGYMKVLDDKRPYKG